jgi:uncharacterized protein (DUF488 family)
VTPLVVFTIGHSTRAIEDFIRLLNAHRVQRVIDVRTIARSRHNPQFNRDQLSPALHRARIHYRYMPGLGTSHIVSWLSCCDQDNHSMIEMCSAGETHV